MARIEEGEEIQGMFVFKQKTAYETSECDWSSTCALPIAFRICQTLLKSLKRNRSYLHVLKTVIDW